MPNVLCAGCVLVCGLSVFQCALPQCSIAMLCSCSVTLRCASRLANTALLVLVCLIARGRFASGGVQRVPEEGHRRARWQPLYYVFVHCYAIDANHYMQLNQIEPLMLQ